jgi:hypothetical protein
MCVCSAMGGRRRRDGICQRAMSGVDVLTTPGHLQYILLQYILNHSIHTVEGERIMCACAWTVCLRTETRG